MYSALVDVAVVVISFAHIPTFELIQHILNKPHTRARDFVKKERDYFLSSFAFWATLLEKGKKKKTSIISTFINPRSFVFRIDVTLAVIKILSPLYLLTSC